MERVFTGQGDNHLFVWVIRLQGELILADCAILLKKGGWKRVKYIVSLKGRWTTHSLLRALHIPTC